MSVFCSVIETTFCNLLLKSHFKKFVLENFLLPITLHSLPITCLRRHAPSRSIRS
jgi:hypothetical protein